VGEDVESFDKLLAANANFRNYMQSPQILTSDKKELVVSVIGERSSGLFINFVMLLIDKKRLENFAEIADGYVHLYEQLKGIVEVRAITAVELDGDLEEKTREKLEEQLGKEVRLKKTVDPSIIGGMILIVEDKIVDGSIRHKLGVMKKELGRLKVH
jgi:F-type H+-transporting ATPase subunit delta